MIETPVGPVPDRRALDRLRAQLAEYNRRYSSTMAEIQAKDWPFNRTDVALMNPPIRAWRSSRFVAALYLEPGKPAHRLSVCRAVLTDDGTFEDGLTWDELQRVKHECGFGDIDAVEIYPRDADVVNVSNMRHLWLLGELCPLAWR